MTATNMIWKETKTNNMKWLLISNCRLGIRKKVEVGQRTMTLRAKRCARKRSSLMNCEKKMKEARNDGDREDLLMYRDNIIISKESQLRKAHRLS